MQKNTYENLQTACLICDSLHSTLFCLKNQHAYLCCQQCGHVYVKERLNDAQIVSLYAQRTSHHGSSIKEQWDYSEVKRKYVYEPLLKRIESLTPVGRLLDIGCSNGSFISTAKYHGWQEYGLELEDSSYQVAKKHEVNVSNQELGKQHFPDNHFSAVTMWQLIEHLANPKEMIREIYRIIKPGGILVVSTPNIKSIAWYLLKEEWGAVEPMVHLNLFNLAGMRRIMQDCGFKTQLIFTTDLKPSTVKQVVRKIKREQREPQYQSIANLANTISEKKMKALLTFRHLINLPLRLLDWGEDIYGYFRK
jgi:SAM-dependent methyltransferase